MYNQCYILNDNLEDIYLSNKNLLNGLILVLFHLIVVNLLKND